MTNVVISTLTRHNDVMSNTHDIPYSTSHEDWNTPDECYCPRNEEGTCTVCEKEDDEDDEA